jgi:hypothetical protein
MTNEERILEIQRTLNDENIELSADEELELLEELSTLNNISINEINNTNQINNTNEMTVTQNTSDILFIEDYTPEQLLELQKPDISEVPAVESNFDIVKRVLNEIYPDSHDILDVSTNKSYFNRLQLASDTKYQIAINFKDVNISNSRGEKTTIDSIYIFFFLNKDCKLLTYLFGYRDITNFSHSMSSYAHSHLHSFDILQGSLTVYNKFCLGASDSAISIPVHNGLADNFSENNFRSLLVTLIGFISWESLEGRPYMYIKNMISYKNNSAVNNNESIQLQSFLQLEEPRKYAYNIGSSNYSIITSSSHLGEINEYFYSKQSIKLLYKHLLYYINNILKVPLRFTTNNINGVLNVTLNLNITDIDNIFASEDFYTSFLQISDFKIFRNDDTSINIEGLLTALYYKTNDVDETHLSSSTFKYLFCSKLNDTYYFLNQNTSRAVNDVRSIEDRIQRHQANPQSYSLLLSTGWKPIVLKEHLEKDTTITESSTIDYSTLTLHPSISYTLIDMLNKHFTKFLIEKQNESSK